MCTQLPFVDVGNPSTTASSAGGPEICSPMESPERVKPHGMEIVGQPLTLNGRGIANGASAGGNRCRHVLGDVEWLRSLRSLPNICVAQFAAIPIPEHPAMRLTLLLVVAAALIVTSDASAQRRAPSAVQSGMRVRLTVAEIVDGSNPSIRYSYLQRIVTGFDNGALILRSDDAGASTAAVIDTVRVRISAIKSAEAFHGTKRHAVVAGIVGFAAAALAGYTVAPDRGSAENCAIIGDAVFCNSRDRPKDKRYLWAAMFGGAGTAAGALVGHFIKTEHWSRIDLEDLRRVTLIGSASR